MNDTGQNIPSDAPRRVAFLPPWARRATEGTLPYKVYASLHTDGQRVHESLSDMLRRTMPTTGGSK